MQYGRNLSLLTVSQWLTSLLPLLMLAGPAPLDIGASLVAALFLVHTVRHKDTAWLQARWVHIVALLWLYMCLRNLFTEDALTAVMRSASFIRYPLFAAALGFWVLRDEAAQKRLWRVLAAAIIFLILDCFWQYHFHTDITGRAAQATYNDALVRLTGPFSNPRVGISIVWLVFPILLPLFEQTAGRARIGQIALVIGTVMAVYLSGERTALLLCMLGIGVSLALYIPARRILLVTVMLAVVAVVGLSRADSALLSRQFDDTRAQIAAFGDSSYGRTWGAALAIGHAHPLVGIGSKHFQNECKKPQYGATDDESLRLRCPIHAHQIYLEWLVEYGLIGLGCFLLLIARWVRDMRDAGPPWRWTPLMLALGITLFLRLWPISVTPSQFVSWSGVPFWLVIGWIYACLPWRQRA